MKKLFFGCLMLGALMVGKASNVIFLEGHYQNKNVYVQNGLGGSGVGFCAFEVKVNGQITTDEVNSTAFEIDLTPFKLAMGQKITIEIYHKEDCHPKVLNPEALKPKPTFDISSITIDREGLLKWSTKNEAAPLPYVVEQFKWNKWVYVGTVDGVGSAGNHDYVFKVTPTSGENKFRVKQVGFNGEVRKSDPVVLNSLMEVPTYNVGPKAITFSSDTGYEVYDYFGNVVKKGYGNSCEISNLGRGTYYLCYDNTMTEVRKR